LFAKKGFSNKLNSIISLPEQNFNLGYVPINVRVGWRNGWWRWKSTSHGWKI